MNNAPEFIIGVGASAGGLDALERFFRSVEPDGKTAYVVIQHLSPNFTSVMDDILGRVTDLPIIKAVDGHRLEPDTIILNQPRTNLTIKENFIQVTPHPNPADVAKPINHFFINLAQIKRAKCVGVILSGTGSDGAEGSSQIERFGGLMLIQPPNEAEYSSMPESAINQTRQGVIRPPEDMAHIIQLYVDEPNLFWTVFQSPKLVSPDEGVPQLIAMLKNHYDVDFSQYKPETLVRQLNRKLGISPAKDWRDFLNLAENSEAIRNDLFRAMLLDVTEFYRDREAFKWIEVNLLPNLVRELPPLENLRLWSAATSSGEEAYSLGISAMEEFERQDRSASLRIFATDIHQGAIETASAGRYQTEFLEAIPYHLRDKYFVAGHSYLVAKSNLRSKIAFSKHDLLSSPYYIDLDLISCRNMLIYIEQEGQEEIISRFLNSLRMGGILFLGPSETLPESITEHFEQLNARWKIFRKIKDGKRRFDRRIEPITNRGQMMEQSIYKRPVVPTNPKWRDALLYALVPVGYVCDTNGKLLEVLGTGAEYIHLSTGLAKLTLPDLLPDPIGLVVAGGLIKAQNRGNKEQYKDLLATLNGKQKMVSVEISPLKSDQANKRDNYQFLLVELIISDMSLTIDDIAQPNEIGPSEVSAGEAGGLVEKKLAKMEESLQATSEELKASNEELQSTNEELQSSIEELQSANEQYQSTNEELMTVNHEYGQQNETLNRIVNDMQNYLRAGEVLIIFIDEVGRLREISPACYDFFGLIPADMGRPYIHFSNFISLSSQSLERFFELAMAGERNQVESSTCKGTPIVLNIIPYLKGQKEIHGVVLQFTDLTSLRKVESEKEKLDKLIGRLSQQSPVVFLLIDSHTYEFLWMSDSIELLTGYTLQEAKNNHQLFQNILHPDDTEEYNQFMKQLNHDSDNLGDSTVEVRFKHKNGHFIWLKHQGSAYLKNEAGELEQSFLTITDVTELRTALTAAEQEYKRLQTIFLD